MKYIYIKKKIRLIVGAIGLGILFLFSACEGDLEPKNFNVIDPSTFFKTESDAQALTNAVYDRFNTGWTGTFLNYKGFFISDMVGGQFFIVWTPPEWVRLNDFTWSALTQNEYAETYFAVVPSVAFATNVIEDIKGIDIPDDVKAGYIAQVRTARALMTLFGYDLYGPLPLVVDPAITKNPFTEFDPVRWTKAEMDTFIETELIEAQADLVSKNDLPSAKYGALTKGAAMTGLMKLYLMQKNWAKVKAITADIMLEGYSLEQTTGSVFSVLNEANDEVIWAQPRTSNENDGPVNFTVTSSVPGDYGTDAFPVGTVQGWGGLRVPWEMYDAYDDQDERKALFPISWLDANGVETDMRANGTLVSGALYLKYDIDPNRQGTAHGNDYVFYRYADVLLARAEALNELTAVDSEAIQLVQEIRDRSNAGPIPASATASQSAFRDFILLERRKELLGEGWSRQDLIRHGKFLDYARNRVLETVPDAAEKHLLFPIPQDAINANPKIEQNPGY
ncbi:MULTISPECIES: RagB/SusD family nutrient uptake outer membrane protein [Arenibacter]|uniref:RagB/SusD family nutrient uptake outer membrane protein n=1 Tax=Arenibacter TaxID=178469 RepID=UPI0012FFE498|nr:MULTISPECIES: RagB/SusD family nutrient uptake outer membrane protein [Arenibacter]